MCDIVLFEIGKRKNVRKGCAIDGGGGPSYELGVTVFADDRCVDGAFGHLVEKLASSMALNGKSFVSSRSMSQTGNKSAHLQLTSKQPRQPNTIQKRPTSQHLSRPKP